MVTAIQEQIKTLVELQTIDAEIYRLKKEATAFPLHQKKAEEEFQKKKAELKVLEDDLKAIQAKQKQKEGDLQVSEEKIKKLQAQLYQLKTNKEYSTMELEIRSLKADKSILEEEILNFLETVDQSKAKFSSEKEALLLQEKKKQEEIESLRKEQALVEGEISQLEDKRKVYPPMLEAKLLTQYERILKNREGLAIVPVRNNACGGCNIGLPPQAVNEIQLQDKLMYCEECARILYWSP